MTPTDLIACLEAATPAERTRIRELLGVAYKQSSIPMRLVIDGPLAAFNYDTRPPAASPKPVRGPVEIETKGTGL